MNVQLNSQLNYEPLVEAIIEKTKDGKIDWRETADEESFIAAVRGKLLFEISRRDQRCELTAKGEDGRSLYQFGELYRFLIPASDPDPRDPAPFDEVKSSLGRLYDLAERLARRLDERVDRSLELVKSL